MADLLASRNDTTVPVVALLDAHSTVGTITSEAIGSHQAQDENAPGGYFHRFLLQTGLFAPGNILSDVDF
jgi:hypothetical protein